jgi:hypothetical protein
MKKEKKFTTFVDAYGNEAHFEEGATEEQIKTRLGWMGKKWVKVLNGDIERARMKARGVL